MIVLKLGAMYVRDHANAEFALTQDPDLASVFDNTDPDIQAAEQFFGTTLEKEEVAP
jgi:hypothetical protein